MFRTLAGSVKFRGLPVAFLRRLIADRKLKALKTGAGWRISRVEFERVSATLADPPEFLEDHAL